MRKIKNFYYFHNKPKFISINKIVIIQKSRISIITIYLKA